MHRLNPFGLLQTQTTPDSQPRAESQSRRSFFRCSAVATTAGAAAALVSTSDAQAQFAGGVSSLAQHFAEIQQHENAHVEFLVSAMGASAYPAPQFVNLRFAKYRDFAALARVFENAGTKAYLGAAPLISNSQILAVAASIAQIEARHAGWLNTLFPGHPLSENNEAFESPLTPQEVAQMVAPYFADQNLPMMLANAIEPTPSLANDGNILRFALGLEYLEREFYNVNVPRFFGQGRR